VILLRIDQQISARKERPCVAIHPRRPTETCGGHPHPLSVSVVKIEVKIWNYAVRRGTFIPGGTAPAGRAGSASVPAFRLKSLDQLSTTAFHSPEG